MAVPRELDAVVLKAMAQRPQDRYAGATEFADELDAFLTKLNKKKHKSEADLRKKLQEILDDWRENFASRERARAKQERTDLAMLNVKRSSRVQLLEQKQKEEQAKEEQAARIAEVRREELAERKAQKLRLQLQMERAGQAALASHAWHGAAASSPEKKPTGHALHSPPSSAA